MSVMSIYIYDYLLLFLYKSQLQAHQTDQYHDNFLMTCQVKVNRQVL